MRRKGGRRAGARSCRLEVGSLEIVGSRVCPGRKGAQATGMPLLVPFSPLCVFSSL